MDDYIYDVVSNQFEVKMLCELECSVFNSDKLQLYKARDKNELVFVIVDTDSETYESVYVPMENITELVNVLSKYVKTED